jgi:hypothetical protein
VKRVPHQRIRLQRVTILRKDLRDLKPTLIVDAPAVQGRSSFDHAAIASPVLVWRLLDVRDRKPGGHDGIASSDGFRTDDSIRKSYDNSFFRREV